MIVVSMARAEQIAGKRLDRRRKYAIRDDNLPDKTTGAVLFEIASWSDPCTGCKCDGEYPCDCCTERGSGCHECGYTGRRKITMWVPYCD